jgi:NDP-sugar pyrophosphorylase family protein
MLIPNLDKFVQLGRVNEFYESVLADLVTSKKLVLCSHEVGNQPWFEIDNLQDLERAESLFDFLDGSTESQVVKF